MLAKRRFYLEIITKFSIKNEDNLYHLGTKEDVLNKMYARSEFDIC